MPQCVYIDGVIVKARDHLWMVKGCFHGKNHVIALPRYGLNGDKIKELAKSLEIARGYGFIAYNEHLDLAVPAIPVDRIEQCLNPFNTDTRGLGRIGERAWELKLIIMRRAHVSSESIGITGSLLARTLIPGLEVVDIDIVVRGVEESRRVYRALGRLREEGVISPINSPVYRELEVQDPRTRYMLMKNRLLEGFYGNTPYSIRLIPCRRQQAFKSKIKRLGWWEGIIEIIEQTQPYIMPYQYRIHVVKTNSLHRPISLISYRMRFSELPIGLRLYLKGALEYHEDEGELKICPDHSGSMARIQETTT